MRLFWRGLGGWLLLLLAAQALAFEIPYLSGRIVDNAEILDPATYKSLASQLEDHERRSGNQVVILTVNDLQGESIETAAEQVFNGWQLGQKGRDNGVLLLVAPSERRLRIEVGYGLEGTLSDVLASRIIRNVITPRFREGDFNAGISAGIQAILATLDGESPPLAEDRAAKRSGTLLGSEDLSPSERILIAFFIFGIIGLFTFIGLILPGIGWFLYFFLIPFWAMFPLIVFNPDVCLAILATYLIAFPIAKSLIAHHPRFRKFHEELASQGSTRLGGLTVRSRTSGGASWSSSSSSGGFSGGGGHSGGGGASGSW